MKEEHVNARVHEERNSDNEVLVIQPPGKKPKEQKSVLSFCKRTIATNISDKNREKSNATNETCSSRSKQKSLSSRNLSKDTAEKRKSGSLAT